MPELRLTVMCARGPDGGERMIEFLLVDSGVRVSAWGDVESGTELNAQELGTVIDWLTDARSKLEAA